MHELRANLLQKDASLIDQYVSFIIANTFDVQQKYSNVCKKVVGTARTLLQISSKTGLY